MTVKEYRMKFGVASMNTDEGVDPLELAREAEALGIESLFLPDHSHVPVVRKVACGEGDEGAGGMSRFADSSPGDKPRDFYRNREQLLTLAAVSAVTTDLKLGTGICLVVQRDPILLAKEVATLDHLSNGRLLFGVGAGTPSNREEMRNHGTDPRTRMRLLTERMLAMQQIWTQDEAEFHGRFVDFGPIHSWPKPVQRPYPRVLVGGDGPTVLERVLTFGDGWMPGHQDDMGAFRARVAELQERAAATGRERVEITVFLAKLDCLDRYADAGVDRVVVLLPTGSPRETLRQTASAAEQFAS
jgi:probable F420-dependent oxidoreductase